MVAMVACLFSHHGVRVIPGADKTEEEARRRAQECADDNNYQFLLRMNHPERVKLECVPA
ncbi:cytochrome P450 monooxygenase 3A7 [Apiospora arundinis]